MRSIILFLSVTYLLSVCNCAEYHYDAPRIPFSSGNPPQQTSAAAGSTVASATQGAAGNHYQLQLSSAKQIFEARQVPAAQSINTDQLLANIKANIAASVVPAYHYQPPQFQQTGPVANVPTGYNYNTPANNIGVGNAAAGSYAGASAGAAGGYAGAGAGAAAGAASYSGSAAGSAAGYAGGAGGAGGAAAGYAGTNAAATGYSGANAASAGGYAGATSASTAGYAAAPAAPAGTYNSGYAAQTAGSSVAYGAPAAVAAPAPAVGQAFGQQYSQNQNPLLQPQYQQTATANVAQYNQANYAQSSYYNVQPTVSGAANLAGQLPAQPSYNNAQTAVVAQQYGPPAQQLHPGDPTGYAGQSELGQLDGYPPKQVTPGDTRNYDRLITTCHPNGKCDQQQLNAGQTDPIHQSIAAATRGRVTPIDRPTPVENTVQVAAAPPVPKRPKDRRLVAYTETIVPYDPYN